VYNRVKILRENLRLDSKKVSQQKLADMIGITRSKLAEFELHNGKISAETENKLMEIFNLSSKDSLYNK